MLAAKGHSNEEKSFQKGFSEVPERGSQVGPQAGNAEAEGFASPAPGE